MSNAEMTGHAVFISVAEYEDENFPSHPTVRASSERLRALFAASRLWTSCTLVTDPAKPDEVMNALEPIARDCDPDDVLLVYFCGHGEQRRHRDRADELHLALGASRPLVERTQLAIHEIYEELGRSPAKAKVLILDCCYSAGVPAPSSLESRLFGASDTTCVITALGGVQREALATRAVGDGTAFSGTLADILSEGIQGAGELLSINDVLLELIERLQQNGYPRPDVILRGIEKLPLLENVERDTWELRERLNGSTLEELAGLWADNAPGENVRAPAVKHYLRGRLADARDARELAHHLHQLDPGTTGLLREFIDIVLSGPEYLAGDTARHLAACECSACVEVAAGLLREAVDRWDVEQLVRLHLALGEPHQLLDTEFAATASVRKFAAALDRLRACADHVAGDAVDRLIELFSIRREHLDIRALLVELRALGREFDAETVLIDAALGRPPADIAALVQLLRSTAEPDGRQVSRLIMRFRRPREAAAFIAGFGEAAGPTMRSLLSIAAELQTPPGSMIRLVRALRSHGLVDAPSAMVGAALRRGTPSATVDALLDGLTDCGPEQGAKIEDKLREYLHHDDTPVEDLVIFLRRTDGPGRFEVLVQDVVTTRRIEDVVELHRHALACGAEQLADMVTRAVIASRGAIDLLLFVHDFEPGPAEELLTRVAQQRDGDTIGQLLSIWSEPQGRPVALRRAETRLPDLFAAWVPVDRLLAARRHLGTYSRHDVLNPVIRKALSQPQRFHPVDVAALLTDLSEHPGRKPKDVVGNAAFTLRAGLVDPQSPVDVVYLAGLVAAVKQEPRIRPQFAQIIVDKIDDMVDYREDNALNNEYVAELRRFGAEDHAEKFTARFDP